MALRSWDDYVDLLKPAGQLVQLTWEPEDEQTRAELYRQLAMNVALGYFMYFQSDPDHPDWTPFLNSVFLLQPNPDDTYFLAPLCGEGSYRIVGERGSVHLLTLDIGRNMMGMSDTPGQHYLQLNVDDLEIGSDGRFELLLSAERPPGYAGNWRALHPDADYVMARQRCYDWGRERDARLAIERIDAPNLKPALSRHEIAGKLELLLGGFTQRLSAMWLRHQKAQRERCAVNEVEFVNFKGGLQIQHYWQAVYSLKEDEALILETEVPAKRTYWNVQLNDSLWNTVEYVYRQSSLNGHQARLDRDGKFRAVLALSDPGVPNWLDTGGYREGTLVGRWYDCDSAPLPSIKRVKLSELRAHLPDDTPYVGAAEREAGLSARRIGAQLRRRW